MGLLIGIAALVHIALIWATSLAACVTPAGERALPALEARLS